MKVERIVWIDSYTHTSNWCSEKTIKESEKDYKLTSFGMVMLETKDFIHISSTRDKKTGCYMGHLAIPRKSIKEREEVTK